MTKQRNGFFDDRPVFPKGQEDLFLEQLGFIYLFGEIDETKSLDIIKSLHRAMTADNDVMHIYINSQGGSVVDAISIYELIRIIATMRDVITIGCGEIMSAATIILQAGNQRLMTKNSIFMMHEMSFDLEGTISQHQDARIGTEMMESIFFDILFSRCPDKKKRTLRKKIDRKETYLTSDQCKRYSLIDGIV